MYIIYPPAESVGFILWYCLTLELPKYPLYQVCTYAMTKVLILYFN